MENNIFKNAYFGKPYKTRGGKKALYQYCDSTLAHLFTESDEIDVYISDGRVDSRFFDSQNDIVSEWDEGETNQQALEMTDNINALIDEAKNIAIEQKRVSDYNKQKRIEEIYNEVLSCLSYQIHNKNIVGGIIKIRTSNKYKKYLPSSDYSEPYGYCNWNLGLVWDYDGIKVAKMIQDKHHIDCQFVEKGITDDSYFKFNFN